MSGVVPAYGLWPGGGAARGEMPLAVWLGGTWRRGEHWSDGRWLAVVSWPWQRLCGKQEAATLCACVG